MSKDATPIEDRANWRIYFSAQDKAIKAGACWGCAVRLAMAEVDRKNGGLGLMVEVCPKCKQRRIAA